MEDDFCESCKVHLEQGISHCPLCGHFIRKVDNEQSIQYPEYKFTHDKKESVAWIFIKLALLSMIVCLGLDLFITHTLSFSLYVLVGLIYMIFVVLLSILKKSSLAQIMTKVAYFTTGLLLFFELYTNTWGWGVCYAIPGVWLTISIVSGICMLSFGYVNFEMFKPMLSIAIMSLVSLILLTCFGETTWLTLATTFFVWSEIALMFMFRFKRSIRSLGKDFRI